MARSPLMLRQLPARTTSGERPDVRILQSLRRMSRAMDLYSRRLAQACNLTGPQLVCLLEVAAKGPSSVARLAQEIYLSASTVVGILDRLEAKGYVQRERSREDRRVVVISITKAGRAIAARAPSPLHDRLAAALQRLSEKEQATIAKSLERIVELMEAEQMDARDL